MTSTTTHAVYPNSVGPPAVLIIQTPPVDGTSICYNTQGALKVCDEYTNKITLQLAYDNEADGQIDLLDNAKPVALKTATSTDLALVVKDSGGATTFSVDGEGDTTVNTLKISSGFTIDGAIDDDSFLTATATNVASAESIKAYVDAQITSFNMHNRVKAFPQGVTESGMIFLMENGYCTGIANSGDDGHAGHVGADRYLPLRVPMERYGDDPATHKYGEQIIVSKVCTGHNNSIILTNDGRLFGMGTNANGDLGTGNLTNYSSYFRQITRFTVRFEYIFSNSWGTGIASFDDNVDLSLATVLYLARLDNDTGNFDHGDYILNHINISTLFYLANNGTTFNVVGTPTYDAINDKYDIPIAYASGTTTYNKLDTFATFYPKAEWFDDIYVAEHPDLFITGSAFFAKDINGYIYSWGIGSNQAGRANRGLERDPYMIVARTDGPANQPMKNVKQVVLTGGSTLLSAYVITDDTAYGGLSDEMYCAGNNTSYAYGDGTSTSVTVFKKVQIAPGVGALKISASHGRNSDGSDWGGFTLIKGTDLKVYSAGENDFGQCGNGTNPITIVGFWYAIAFGFTNSNIQNVFATGGYYSTGWVVDGNGDLWGCGYNGRGTLGLGNTINQVKYIQPINYQLFTGKVAKVVQSNRLNIVTEATYILLTDGQVWATGDNRYGQIAFPQMTLSYRDEFAQMDGAICGNEGRKAVDIFLAGLNGDIGVYVLYNDGLVRYCGRNSLSYPFACQGYPTSDIMCLADCYF